MTDRFEFINPSTLGAPPGPISRAVRVGDMLMVSGTSAISGETGDPLLRPLSKDFATQARLTFQNLEKAVVAGGATKRDIVKTIVMLRNREDWATFNRVRTEFFGDHRPASTAFLCGLFRDDMLVEIEALAVIPSRRSDATSTRRNVAGRRSGPAARSRKSPKR
jgi:2-iminobutanoate/2-iminopropanoate deaminase